MATLPKATVTVSQTAAAVAQGQDVICIFAPCATSADTVPRQFGSAEAAYAQHGYCDGIEYAAYHVSKTGKAFIMVGLPIATAGVVGRVDKTGNSGSSVASVAAGGSGVLGEHDGVVTVDRAGTVGTDQIVLNLSLDGGRFYKKVRLGTATSYVIPYVGVTLSFTVGTLIAGDTVISWHGTSPRSDATGWAAARTALASQLKFFRSIILMGELQDSTEAAAFLAQIAAYRTANERFVYARASNIDRLPQAALSHDLVRMTGSPTLTFLEVGGTGDTITRSSGSWISDGFQIGDTVTIAGSVSNNVTGVIANLTATVLTFGTTDLANEGPVSNCTAVATPTLTFAEVGGTGDTVTRSRGSWTADGFRVGDLVTFAGTASNNVTTDGITAVTALVMTLNTTDLAAEVIGATSSVTAVTGQTKAAWAAAREAAMATVTAGDDGFRLDLDLGKGRFPSPFSAWNFRRPLAWFASAREYSHDLHVATWRKSDGPLPCDLFDSNGTLVEYDDRADGGAASAARFTSARTWGNGPAGGFISQSLTRADDSSLLGHTAKVAVTNLACTTVQINTENAAIGQDLILNDDGTATSDALSRVQKQVQDALDLALLINAKGEGPRASKAVWTPSPNDVYNVAEPTMTGVLDLNLNGTVHSVNTTVRIRSAG
jgi:hypothetical protein